MNSNPSFSFGETCQYEQKIIEKSWECHNHKSRPTPDIKRKIKGTMINACKINRCTRSTYTSSFFPQRGDHNAKRTEKNIRTKKNTRLNMKRPLL